jgi:hypothetical protein
MSLKVKGSHSISSPGWTAPTWTDHLNTGLEDKWPNHLISSRKFVWKSNGSSIWMLNFWMLTIFKTEWVFQTTT